MILILLYMTGITCTEITRLKWGHINERANDATIKISSRGKERTVQIPGSVLEKLKILKENELEDGTVFRSRQGDGVISYSTIREIVKGAFKNVGVDMKPQQLRYSFAMESFACGATPVYLMGALGHSGLTVTGGYLRDDVEPKRFNYMLGV